jgi:hypothetical protein
MGKNDSAKADVLSVDSAPKFDEKTSMQTNAIGGYESSSTNHKQEL